MTFPPFVPVLKVYAGDTFEQSFVFTSDGSPRNLVAEGWASWHAQVRRSPEDADHVDFVIDHTQANVGRITLKLSRSATAELTDGVFDLQASDSGVTTTFLRGSVSVAKDITRV